MVFCLFWRVIFFFWLLIVVKVKLLLFILLMVSWFWFLFLKCCMIFIWSSIFLVKLGKVFLVIKFRVMIKLFICWIVIFSKLWGGEININN